MLSRMHDAEVENNSDDGNDCCCCGVDGDGLYWYASKIVQRKDA